MRHPHRNAPAPTRGFHRPGFTRPGFTLIELLVVIVILGILVGLLVPAVMNAITSANNAAVSAEIQSLSQALAGFKAQYNCYPPSRIVIAEDGDYSPDNVADAEPALVQRSLTALRRCWPRLKLASDGSKPAISGGWYDVNGDCKKNAAYVVSGHEALCLFLGGVPMATADGFAMTGFATDPSNPFQGSIPPATAGAWPYSSNRTTPLMNFRPGALKATVNSRLPAPNNGPLVGYTDRYGQFFAYFSAYDGQGYDPDDVDFVEPDDTETIAAIRGGLQAGNAPTSVRETTRTDLVSSRAPNPYLSDSPLPVSAAGALVLTDRRPKAYWNASTYQIVSAGKDGKFGIGGQWSQKANEPLPFYAAANASATKQTLSSNARQPERDNLTNFSGGKLD